MIYIPRNIDNFLLAWVSSDRRKPLILRGARQVGKSNSVLNLGKQFENIVTINFEKQPQFKDLFTGEIAVSKIVESISLITGSNIIPGKTLLFLDEVQACPQVITSLRYFYEEMQNLHVIAAGSLLEFALQKIGVPVGRVQTAYMYPLTFFEFLDATNSSDLKNKIKESCAKNESLPELVHEKVLKDFKTYALIGGMPEVIKEYVKTGSVEIAYEVLTEIVETYRGDILKYTKQNRFQYVNQVFEALPTLIGKKFKYANVNKEVQSKVIGEALNLLVTAGIAYKVHHTSANGLPLGAEKDLQHFKVLFLDCGLINKILGFDLRTFPITTCDDLVNKGNLIEQIVGTELIASSACTEMQELYYWHREAKNSNAEIDYLGVAQSGDVYPIEVKAGEVGRMKSMQQFFLAKPQVGFGVKYSARRDCAVEEVWEREVVSRPVYMVGGGF